MKSVPVRLMAIASVLAAGSAFGQASLSSAFLYQGQLRSAGAPVSGEVELQFSLWDAWTGGTQVAWTLTRTDPVVNGLFTSWLDFGPAAFEGHSRYLEIALRSPPGSGSWTTLSPRQPVLATPYAQYALKTGGLALPLSATQSHASELLQLTNTGTGGAATFISNTGTALYACSTAGPPAAAVAADGLLQVGSKDRDGHLLMFNTFMESPFLRACSDSDGGKIDIWDSSGRGAIQLYADDQHEGGYIRVDRGDGDPGFVVDGNCGGDREPFVQIAGKTRSALFDMRSWQQPNESVVLPTDSVASPEILDEPGVAAAREGTPDLTAAVKAIASRTIDVPADGYVLVLGTTTAVVDHPIGDPSRAMFAVSDSDTTMLPGTTVTVSLYDTLPPGVYRFPLTCQAVFRVKKGPNTFHFVAQRIASLWSATWPALTLVYLPTAYGTVTTPYDQEPDQAAASTAGSTGSDPDSKVTNAQPLDRARIERELAEVKTKVAQLEAMLRQAR